jgi:protein TonB
VLTVLGRFYFMLIVLASCGLHVTLAVCLWLWGLLGTVSAEVIPPREGRYSLQLQAMAVVVDTPPDDPTRELDAPTPRADEPAVRVLTLLEMLPPPPVPPAPPPPPEFIDPKTRELLKSVEEKRQARTKARPDNTEAPPGPQNSPSSVASEGSEVEVLPDPSFANPLPPYPADLLAAGVTGTVKLRVVVGANGRVQRSAIEVSSGYQSFDDSALSTVQRRWVFRPAKRRGVPVDYEVILPVHFTIRNR